ncbi:hypothetical protein J6590_065021 [Homalodisca vitripennis]|nr:hypothetical protein J6590_065021 [Homalodisca vitripennis]
MMTFHTDHTTGRNHTHHTNIVPVLCCGVVWTRQQISVAERKQDVRVSDLATGADPYTRTATIPSVVSEFGLLLMFSFRWASQPLLRLRLAIVQKIIDSFNSIDCFKKVWPSACGSGGCYDGYYTITGLLLLKANVRSHMHVNPYSQSCNLSLVYSTIA